MSIGTVIAAAIEVGVYLVVFWLLTRIVRYVDRKRGR